MIMIKILLYKYANDRGLEFWRLSMALPRKPHTLFGAHLMQVVSEEIVLIFKAENLCKQRYVIA